AGPKHTSRSPQRRLGHGSALRPAFLASSLAIASAVTFFAPLAVGSVHRPAVLIVTSVAALALCLLLAGEVLAGRSIRLTAAALLPLALLDRKSTRLNSSHQITS